MAEFCQNRSEAGERGPRGEHQKGDRAVIVDGGAVADRSDRCVRRGPTAQRQIKHDAKIPADKNARRHAPGQGNERQRDRDAERCGNKQSRMRVHSRPSSFSSLGPRRFEVESLNLDLFNRQSHPTGAASECLLL